MTGRPSLAFAGTLERAYRRACRVGIAEVGTDLVLSYAALRVRAVWDVLPVMRQEAWRPVRKGKSGLTDPRPPARNVRAEHLDDEAAFEADAVLREAAFNGSDMVRLRHRRKKELPPLPAFSPAVRHAVHEAIRDAARQGVEHAGPEHLLVALLALPDSAAYRLLAEWRVPGHASLGGRVRADRAYRRDEVRQSWVVTQLTLWRVLPAAGPRLLRGPWRAVVWLLGRKVRRPYHRHGALYGHPVVLLIAGDAMRQAVQTGHAVVTATDVLLSVIDVHEQLVSAGRTLPDDVARWNQGGAILAGHGVRGRAVTRAASRLASVPGDREEVLAGLPTRGWPPLTTAPGIPAEGRTALAALRGASLSAYRLGHPYAGTTHLLGALLAEPGGPVERLLRELGVDPDVVRSEVARRLPSVG